MSRKLPLVVILGPTGSGKTKLSLEVATKFGGEIIGADSMQSDKLPVVVGGTNYYIESLLWRILVQNPEEKVLTQTGMLPSNQHELASSVLHEQLKRLDPAMARRLHPNNKRKILRSLEILHQRGKKHSEIIDEQCQTSMSTSGGGLRYDNAVVFWLQCDQDVLNKRLDDRVDKMIEEGLLEELLHFHKVYNQQRLLEGGPPDYTKGIFQSIGFKEFHSYLILSEAEKTSEVGRKLLQLAIDELKMVTRRYARKQIKWMSNRFLSRKDRQVPPIYALDTSDVAQWTQKVTNPAFRIVESHICGTLSTIEPLPMRDTVSVPNLLDDSYLCEVCNRIFVGKHQRDIHMNSRKHRKILANKAKQQKLSLASNEEACGSLRAIILYRTSILFFIFPGMTISVVMELPMKNTDMNKHIASTCHDASGW
ncbi:hypothetical protein D910_02029 [Dendroctonus ponderosae]|uniref:C2H2-type domain-containing protein n=1 Tax=Dendroctonus ponderosae TaxID=77166 RepID=U4U1W4_DENPD|nr:hypothetical protein D910_02029 [Dendroctonus ponderosae]